MKEDKDGQDYRKYLRFAGAPFVLVVAPILGYFIGLWLDGYLETAPYLSFIFLFLGIISGIREFYKMIKAFGEGDNDQPR